MNLKLKRLLQSVGIVFLSMTATGVTNYFFPQKVVVVKEESTLVHNICNDVPVLKSTVPPEFATGWVKDEEAVNTVIKSFPIKGFEETPAGVNVEADELPMQVFMWDYHKKVNGSLPKVHNQGQVGSCVSFGTARSIENTLVAAIANGDLRFKYNDVAEEPIYGGSRVEIGGGQLRGDGSVGAWAAKYATIFGTLFKLQYDVLGQSEDFRVYSEARCRSYGSQGLSTAFETEAKKFPVKDAVMVTTWKDAKKALAQGYAIAVCSDQGFTMQRDSKGICYPQGQWAHCMSIDGYYIDPITLKEYCHITNSWGANAHTGNVGWGNPNTAGFWTDSAVVSRMLSQRDSWAFSGVKGFPSRKLNWIKNVKPNKLEKELKWLS
jgi:hypothetical protein